MKWACETCTYLNLNVTKCEMCNSEKPNEWQTVKRKQKPKNLIKICKLGKVNLIRNKQDPRVTDNDAFKNVSTSDNEILNEIKKNIDIIGPNLLGHKFYINPGSKYLIEIVDANNKKLLLSNIAFIMIE